MRTILVTGANSGIGFELTRLLAAQGERVIMAVRDEARGSAARNEILQEVPQADLRLERLDLTDLRTVHALAARLPAFDVLVNNAGIGSGPKVLTAEGVTTIFAANHLGHFLLTALLHERVRERIVTVTSGFGKKGQVDLDNIDGSRGYSQIRAYMQAKIANSLFGAELDRRLRASGSATLSVLAHPGVAATEIQKKADGIFGLVGRLVSATIAKPASHGASALLAAVAAPSEGGDIWAPAKRVGAAPVKEKRWPSMDECAAAAALWSRSETLTGTLFLSPQTPVPTQAGRA